MGMGRSFNLGSWRAGVAAKFALWVNLRMHAWQRHSHYTVSRTHCAMCVCVSSFSNADSMISTFLFQSQIDSKEFLHAICVSCDLLLHLFFCAMRVCVCVLYRNQHTLLDVFVVVVCISHLTVRTRLPTTIIMRYREKNAEQQENNNVVTRLCERKKNRTRFNAGIEETYTPLTNTSNGHGNCIRNKKIRFQLTKIFDSIGTDRANGLACKL